MEISGSFTCFYNTLACAFEQFVPKVKVRDKNSRPWYNADLRKLRNKRNNEYTNKMKGQMNRYECIKLEFDLLNKRLYDQYLQKLSKNIKSNPKKFWSFIKSQRSSSGYESKMSYGNSDGKNDIY